MPEPLTQYNLDLWIAFGPLASAMLNWRNIFYDLGNQIVAQNWAAAQQACNKLGNDYVYIKQKLCDSGGIKGKVYAPLDWIDDNWPDGDAEVTMDAILSAMITADFAQLQTFVGLVDAYRVALWNEPFNAEYYAALARGFMP